LADVNVKQRDIGFNVPTI